MRHPYSFRAFSLLACLLLPGALWSQTAETIVRQTLEAHGRALVTDIMAIGSTTTSLGVTEPVTLYAKGLDAIRIETGSATSSKVFVIKGRQGSAGAEGNDKALNPDGQRYRPVEFPFLDLLAEVDHPNVVLTYLGRTTLGGRPVHHVAVHLTDPKAAERFLRRAHEERVEYFIDVEHLLVLRSVRLRQSEQSMDLRLPLTADYGDYRRVQNVAVPFRVVQTLGGGTRTFQVTTEYSTVSINPNTSDSMFVPRIGGRP